MSYSDLDAIHVPAAGNRAPASWGLQVNANFDAIYDDVLAKLGVWTSYTPSLQQGGNVSKTVTYARYIKLGRLVVAEVYLQITGSGSSSTAIEVGLPATAAQSIVSTGTFRVYDASVSTNRTGIAVLANTGEVSGLMDNVTDYMGAAGFTAALASGDSVIVNVTYEAAS